MKNMQTSPKTISKLVQKETRTASLFVHIIAQQMNIQFSDIHCLHYLLNNGSATAGDIANITGLTTGAVTAMLDRLEQIKFIQRQADENDRRKIIIKLRGDNFQKDNIANYFFTKEVSKLISSYSKKDQKIIEKWNQDITALLQKQIEQLNSNTKS